MNDQDKSAKDAPLRGGLVLVEFGGHRRGLYRNPDEYPFKRGDLAVVEADRGHDAGLVKHSMLPLPHSGTAPDYTVVRRGLSADWERMEMLKRYNHQALEVCHRKVASHKLPMKVVDGEYRFDGMKLTFYFTAEGRVDFRELVRDLAGTFRTRIELRQIGARDETKRTDGYGTCGNRLCCVNHLNSFQTITTQMARVQNLILNPAKLSGVCGRLKCCLAFEYSLYAGEPMEHTPVSVIEDSRDNLDSMSD